MAAIVHGTLEADAVMTVIVNWTRDISPQEQPNADVEVINVDGAAAIYYRFDGNAPSVEGDDCHVLPAAICGRPHRMRSVLPVTVKLISNGTPKFSVRGV
jgi:hypothetical protein